LLLNKLLLNQNWEDHVTLVITKEPFARKVKVDFSEFVVSAFSVLELSMDIICTEFVENTCVKNTDGDTVGSEIESKEDVEAVGHDSESDFAHGVAAVFEITLEQMDF